MTARRALPLVAAAFLFHLVQGILIDGPWLLPAELRYADGARSLVLDAPHGVRTLASLLSAPLWLATTPTAYALVKALGALAVAVTAWPAYLLARELGAHPRAAALASAASVLAPATLLASTTLPVALAYPVTTAALLELERGRRTRAAALFVFAGLVWFPLLWLAGAMALLALGRRSLEWPGAAAIAIVPPAVYAAWQLAALGDKLRVGDAALALGVFVLAVGVLPLGAALRRVPLVVIAALGVAAAFAGGSGLAAREAPLLAAVPLVAAAAAVTGTVLPALALAAGLALELVAAFGADGAPRYAIPFTGPLTVLTAPGSPTPPELIRFWNPEADVAVPPIDKRSYDPATGFFHPPLYTRGRVFDLAGARVDGTQLQAVGGGLLLSTPRRARAAETIEGLYSDGWSGPVATYRRFAPAGLHTMRVLLDRREFASPDVPSAVQVLVGPVGGALVARYTVVLHSGERQAVHVAVPPAPFEVRVTFTPPFSPASYGLGDNRELGAKINFTYGA